MDEKIKLTIVIPAYNEADSIANVVEELKKRYKDYEIIVVDDGSNDKTYEVAKETAVKVIRHSHNKGYGASLKTGIRAATADLICTVDADGQHNPDDVRRLFCEIENSNYDMVVGDRTGKSHSLLIRRFGKSILFIVANYLAGRKIPDLNSGLRIFRKNTINKFMHILPNGFSFSTTSTLALIKEGYEVGYIPIIASKRMGKSRSSVRPIRDGIQTLILIIRIITLFDPLKVFLPISVFFGLFGGMYLIYGIIIYRDIPDTAMSLILTGIVIFLVGILADQISNLRRQHKD